ncbi:hypothetical protein NLU13_6672 [Sarocladium strictum]|uniref:Biotrophy-associated secreted protein 2 n=1 Tax=Sarocladium strictum TaxID=5046 RepID=A0AA39GDT8_SARSR|nr:hypothetical protein NLU13_6672 [Sarocladium strictum]
MVKFTYSVILARTDVEYGSTGEESDIWNLVAAIAHAVPCPRLKPDPAGAANVGNGKGLQFITGACLNNADCASGCCAGLNGAGICSGPAVGNAQGKTGCGFGGEGAAVQTPAPVADQGEETENAGETPAGIDESAAGAQNVGKGLGSQFITGQCFSNADCASGCCAGRQGSTTGACSAVLVAEANGKTGCGFVQT